MAGLEGVEWVLIFPALAVLNALLFILGK